MIFYSLRSDERLGETYWSLRMHGAVLVNEGTGVLTPLGLGFKTSLDVYGAVEVLIFESRVYFAFRTSRRHRAVRRRTLRALVNGLLRKHGFLPAWPHVGLAVPVWVMDLLATTRRAP